VVHDITLILTITSGLTAALCLGYLTHLLRLSPIVGYLLAGIVVGPYTPGFSADLGLTAQLAEIGVILLMFGVGLHFHLEDLVKVRRIAIPGAIVQIAVAATLGMLVTGFFNWSWQAGLVLGFAISVASTVVLTRVLVDNNALHTSTGHIAIGWLVVEDLFTVIALVLLPAISAGGVVYGWDIVMTLLIIGAKIAALVVLVFWLGSRVVPWLFARMSSTRSQELFTLTVLVSALGLAVGAATIFNVSMALGAFLAGMVVGRSEYGQRAASDALPMRDAFAVLFFVSVGMLLNPQTLIDHWALVSAIFLVVIIGKSIAAFAIVLIFGYPLLTALGVSVALAQIGEFSFILGAVALSLGLVPKEAVDILVAVAIASITINPLLYRAIPLIDRWIAKRPKLARWLTSRLRKNLLKDRKAGHVVGHSLEHHAIVVGCGPVGQTLIRVLTENGIECTIIDLNLETTRRLLRSGVHAIYGDASRKEILESAGVKRAGSLILAASNIPDRKELVRLAKQLNPGIQIMGRTAYVRELKDLIDVDPENVFSGEGEVAIALTETVLRSLGASSEQIDRERKRVRDELSESVHGDPANRGSV